MDLVHSSYVTCSRGPCVRHHRAVARVVRRAEDDVSRRGPLSVAALALGALAVDASLRRSARYAPAGPVIWPPKLFKETLRKELVKGEIWGIEQVIAFFTVSANIRMLVVRLQDGKLWVCGPIAPTQECLNLLDELGEVGHLVVPGTALEHKSSLADFARIYPKASVWVSPGQGASPTDPPLGPRIDGVLGRSSAPWENEIECKVFYVAPPETAGTYAETAFFHKKTKTLLLTDAVLKVPQQPPEILASYGYDGTPRELSEAEWYYKFLAFNFLELRGQDRQDFDALAKAKGVVSPILRFTLYPICQAQALRWVTSVAAWPFRQALAAHLAEGPFPLTPQDFLEAFGFLQQRRSSWEPEAAQLVRLRQAAETLDGPQALESPIWTPWL
ncbi:unnamed protein product [Cladocopium goreaui]|uniref:Metallo-beta-lactamase domain-containing protein n=1 Tax=Cladocopium goreaui TaxID=2562237 RepID=A0A9P1DBG6_9DINO|nr:unnamed protein product [Cladocopium goreaui]